MTTDEEQERQEGLNGGFGNDVSVESVAEVDGVDVVAGRIISWNFTTKATRAGGAAVVRTIPDRCTLS